MKKNQPNQNAFATTRWTLVQMAGQSESPEADAALESLCQIYWVPLYGFVRNQGFGKEDAEDLTQAFLSSILERKDLSDLHSKNGRLRSFFIVALKHFLSNERDRKKTWKRGGRAQHLSLDWQFAEGEFELADTSIHPPDVNYDHQWTLALLRRVLTKLEIECSEQGQGDRFQKLKGFLELGSDSISYQEVAKELGLEIGTAKVAVHRLRKRYRLMLRQEIAQTLNDPAMVNEELAMLVKAFVPYKI